MLIFVSPVPWRNLMVRIESLNNYHVKKLPYVLLFVSSSNVLPCICWAGSSRVQWLAHPPSACGPSLVCTGLSSALYATASCTGPSCKKSKEREMLSAFGYIVYIVYMYIIAGHTVKIILLPIFLEWVMTDIKHKWKNKPSNDKK